MGCWRNGQRKRTPTAGDRRRRGSEQSILRSYHCFSARDKHRALGHGPDMGAGSGRFGPHNRTTQERGADSAARHHAGSVAEMATWNGPRLDRDGRPAMSAPPEFPKPLTRSADATLADLTPERLAAHEAAYRRGVHQALAFAGDVVDRAETLKDARRILCRAENVAGELRYKRKHQGRGMLLDYIGSRLRWPNQEDVPARRAPLRNQKALPVHRTAGANRRARTALPEVWRTDDRLPWRRSAPCEDHVHAMPCMAMDAPTAGRKEGGIMSTRDEQRIRKPRPAKRNALDGADIPASGAREGASKVAIHGKGAS